MKSIKLLSPDSAEGTVENDPLSEAAGGVNTDFPVLAPDRILRFSIAKCTKETNTEKASESIKMKIRLESDNGTFQDGKSARKGFSFNHNIGITPTENYSIDDVKRNLAMWLKPLLGEEKAKTTSLREFVNRPEMLEGLVFDGRTGIKKDKNGVYPPSTVVSPVTPG